MDAQRGLAPEQLEYISGNETLMELLKREELFLGIRNGYFNLYFQGASLARFEFTENGGLKIETHQKYLGKNGESYECIPLTQLMERYEEMKANIKKVQTSGGKGWKEKSTQQALILANNRNPNSEWYCLDMEYAQARTSRDAPNYGRCDIIAVKRTPDGNGLYQVALIELKVGHDSYDSEIPKEEMARINRGEFSISEYSGSLGSGIVGHLADFWRFENSGQFETLCKEVCAILSNKRKLGVPCPVLQPEDLQKTPHFYFLTLSSKIETSRKKMYHRLGVKGWGRLAAYHAQRVLGSTFLDRENYHFLFAPEEMNERKRLDILGEPDIETL